MLFVHISWEEKFEANVEDGDTVTVSGKGHLGLQDASLVSGHTGEHLEDMTLTPLSLLDLEIVIFLGPGRVWKVLKCFLTVDLITLSDHGACVLIMFWQNKTIEKNHWHKTLHCPE